MGKEKIIKSNVINIIGVLTEADLKNGKTADGREYISGRISVKSVINNVEQVTEAEIFSMRMTQAGTESKLYTTYLGLPDLVNERVVVQGEIEENKFYNKEQSSVINYNRISAKFINIARASDVDSVRFKIAGYVVQPVTEILDQESNVLGHRIILGVANYNFTLPHYITLNINDENIAKVAGDIYQTGDTVEFEGNFIIQTETIETKKEAAFGDLTDSITRTFKQFVIDSGSNPITTGAYDIENIQALTAAYKQHTLDIEQKAKDSNNALGGNKTKTGLGASLL